MGVDTTTGLERPTGDGESAAAVAAAAAGADAMTALCMTKGDDDDALRRGEKVSPAAAAARG